ncbi:MAG: XdhC/CoxI family protein [Proteobacteria bacterium]|nr:XdhC/CoxI family protein [Pseudomonadota bacterium]
MWIDKVKEMTDSGMPFVLATIIRTQGSTPRGIGTRMIVAADGTIHGTIGGGDVENIVRGHAGEVLKNNQPEILRFSLNGDPWQVTGNVTVQGLCGGSLEVLLEPFTPEIELVIFGGGHIGHKLALLCDVMEIPYRIYDNREEFASPDRFPTARDTVCAPYEQLENLIHLTASSYCLILTNNHNHDHVVLKALLVNRQIPYIGMIGSQSKVGALIKKIGECGIYPDKRLYTPVGLNIGRRKPQDIALSIMAEILAVVSGDRPDHCRLDWPTQPTKNPATT